MLPTVLNGSDAMNAAQLGIAILLGVMTGQNPPGIAQNPAATRPVPPTRDPNTPGYVTARELPDGAVPPADADGNFIIGPTHTPAPEMTVREGVPQGTVYNFTMSSAGSKIYPGIARDRGTFGTPDPNDPAKLIVHQTDLGLKLWEPRAPGCASCTCVVPARPAPAHGLENTLNFGRFW